MNTSQYQIETTAPFEATAPDHAPTGKPPFSVPTMTAIRALAWNGLTVASTFSGCGGSCLGYRMAGFKVLWANEFIPAAQESYRANASPDSILDPRDIRNIQPEEILLAAGLRKGELDVFDGSPPCQAFSTAGKREKGWGEARQYENGARQCNETLFDEYIRILRGLMPKVFVAENVSGLVKGTAKGYFLDILAALKASGYRVQCRVLDAQWLGVPQSRQRTIFIGVREDLGIEPAHPKPFSYRYSVRDALPWIGEIRQSGVFDEPDRVTAPAMTAPAMTAQGMGAKRMDNIFVHDTSGMMSAGNITDRPSPAVMANRAGTHFVVQSGARPRQFSSSSSSSPAIMAGRTTEMRQGTERRKFTIAELKRICAFPDDFILTGSYSQQWERLGNAVPPLMMKAIAETIRDSILMAIR